MFDYSKEPYASCGVRPLIWERLVEYGKHGTPVGHFLAAVLGDELFSAAGRADDTNRRCLREIALFVYNELPAPCWGSPEKVRAGLAKHASARVAI